MNVQTTKRNRRRTLRKRRAVFLLILLFIALSVFVVPRLLGLSGDCSVGSSIIRPALDLTEPASLAVETDDLFSSCALLLRLDDGSVLLQKNSSERTYPASLTKMMTVLTFLENYEDRNDASANAGAGTDRAGGETNDTNQDDLYARLESETFTLPREIFPILAAKHASMAGFQPGETVTLLDLLYACHLPSGADGSMGLAYAIAGSEQGFVDLMNEKAAELGMENTHFANVTGLHDPQHYTTAEDLSRLLTHALKNDAFRTIFTAKKHMIAPTNLHPEGFTVYSTVAYKMKDLQVNRTEVLGGKTGYTEEAGLCLASLAKKGSREYIMITMGAPGNTHTEQYNIDDARTVYGAM